MSGLNGKTPFQEAQVDEWIAFSQTSVWPNMFPVIKAAFGHVTVPQAEFNDAVKTLKAEAKKLDTHLKNKSYLVGDSVSTADIVVACSLILAYQSVFDAGVRKAMPNVSAWFARCVGLPYFVGRLGYIKMTDKAMKAFDPNAKPEPVAAPAKEEEDDDLDLFGSEDEGDAEAAKKAAAAAKEAAKGGKKEKKKVIAMSLVMLEVKPLDDTTNLDDLSQRIFTTITQEGLYWKTEYKKEPVAFGIFKLIIGFSLEDEKVSVDEVVERIEALEDAVQSVEIAVFNKI